MKERSADLGEQNPQVWELECEEVGCDRTPTKVFDPENSLPTFMCDEHAEIFPTADLEDLDAD